MPRYQRRQVRLNAPVQGLEDNIPRQTNNPVMHDAFPVRYTPRLQPLTFKAASSGSGTKCGMVWLVKRRSPIT